MSAWPLNPTWLQVRAQILNISMPFNGRRYLGIRADAVATDSHIRKWPWMHLWPQKTPWLQVTVLVIQVCMGLKTALSHQERHRWRPRSWSSLWSFVATWTKGISTDSGYSRITYPDMAPGNSLRPNVVVTWVDIVIHQDQQGITGDLAHKCLHAPR